MEENTWKHIFATSIPDNFNAKIKDGGENLLSASNDA
jgi:hypothetical protein